MSRLLYLNLFTLEYAYMAPTVLLYICSQYRMASVIEED